MTSPDAPGEVRRRIHPTHLVETRLQLHYAAQLVAAVGRSLAPRQPGFRHAALSWDDGLRGLTGAALENAANGGGRPWHAELRFEAPAIAFVDMTHAAAGTGRVHDAVPLGGLTFDETWRRLRESVRAAGFPADDIVLKLPRDMPAHSLREGVPFGVGVDGAAAVGGWFRLANRALAEAAGRHGIPGPVPCWGDHFDLAVRVAVGPEATVTLGFSPGDATITEPYLYVLPWPVSHREGLPGPPRSGGRWQTRGWVGLALPATDIADAADPSDTAGSFLEDGFHIARAVVVAA